MTHALGSYPVYVELGRLARLPELAAEHLAGRRVALFSDETVLTLYRDWQAGDASHPWRTAAAPPPHAWDLVAAVSPGEASKTRERWSDLTDALLQAGFGRDSAVLALGGGVVGDLAGFVAATYARGIPYIQVPTTLLAMLDASVGGKTGVDVPEGKNLVGAFHHPAAVLIDPATLATLPERDYRAGLAEAVKHGLALDADYFRWLEQETPALRARTPATLVTLIRWSVGLKGGVVAEDEREAGRRAVLNAGHTIGHALEQATGYALLHGEAVALGLVAECRLAERLGLGEAGLADRVVRLLSDLGLPVSHPGVDPARFLAAMGLDKKAAGGVVRFALPCAVGQMCRSGDRWSVKVEDTGVVLEVLETLQA